MVDSEEAVLAARGKLRCSCDPKMFRVRRSVALGSYSSPWRHFRLPSDGLSSNAVDRAGERGRIDFAKEVGRSPETQHRARVVAASPSAIRHEMMW